MANVELKTASGGSVTLVPEDGVGNVTATVKHESGVLASEAHADFVAGVGRTWQNVTASRNFGVTYTNNTGRDIEVSCYYQLDGAGLSSRLLVTVDGLGSVSRSSVFTSTYTGALYNAVSFTVPNGSTYSISSASSSGTGSWSELR